MKICSKCGSVIDDTQAFCDKCGNKVDAVSQTSKKKKKKLGCLIPLIIVAILIVVGIVNMSNSMENEAPFVELVDQPLSEAISKVDELGYSAKYFYDNGKKNNDYTEVVQNFISNDKSHLKKYVITKYDNVDSDKKTVDLFINTIDHVDAQKAASELENTLGHINACQAVEQYGSIEYPYGFKLHYVTDLQGYEMTGDNDTWRIKCSATVTNAYGAEGEFTCEAKVTGTNNNPSVIEFNVY